MTARSKSPPRKRGGRADETMERYLNFGAAGEVRNLFKQLFDLPRSEAVLSKLWREAHPIGAAERR